MKRRLDRIDMQLLACLQANNLQTADDLAVLVGRSPSVIARRLRRLRATKTIAADVSVLSEGAVGDPMFAIVHVQLERHSPDEYAVLRDQLSASPNIQLCLEISGIFDLMLLAVAVDMTAYNELARELLMDQPAVRRFETTFVKKRVKATLALPVS